MKEKTEGGERREARRGIKRGREEERKGGKKKRKGGGEEGGKERRVCLSSAGHWYLDLGPASFCYQGRSKAER